jgi:fatty acid desaturase
LFLNNNFHAVHHRHPKLAWYHLPALYHQQKAAVLAQNHDYYFRNYAAVFRAYLLRSKDPVAHPLWPGQGD